MNLRPYIEKLQALPENKKKIILFLIVIILALIMGFFWVNEAISNFSKIEKSAKSINLPTVDVIMPSLDILQTVTPSNENSIK